MFGLYFSGEAAGVIRNDDGMRQDALQCASSMRCWKTDVYLAPSAFEAGFVSAQHDDAVIDRPPLQSARKAFATIVRRLISMKCTVERSDARGNQ
jgi:glutamate-1-semialdehyde 2,1-aminomutase